MSFVSRDPRGNIEVEGKQDSPVIKCFVILPNSKIENKTANNLLLDVDWHTNLPQFQGARPDHVRVESCCFSRELVSFVRPRVLSV